MQVLVGGGMLLLIVMNRASDMVKFLEEVDRRYEGVIEGFVKERLGLTVQDLETARRNLRVAE